MLVKKDIKMKRRINNGKENIYYNCCNCIRIYVFTINYICSLFFIAINNGIKKYTTYKAGGLGRFLVIPDNRDSLIKLLNYIKKNNL